MLDAYKVLVFKVKAVMKIHLRTARVSLSLTTWDHTVLPATDTSEHTHTALSEG